jgi:hypothetical protein
MENKLTSEMQETINNWNDHASEVTDNAMQTFIPTWFGNIRSLIASKIPLQSINLLVEMFASKKRFVVLGSGPSIPSILDGLPYSPERAILCGPTAIGALLIKGFSPDLLVVADSNPIQYSIIRDLNPDVGSWKVALPTTADPSWYAEDSIFKPSQIYFYHSFLSVLDNIDLAYNHILKALVPEADRYLAQAGSVSNAMINLLYLICGEDASKRIYLGIDCCGWLTNPPQMRAPAARALIDGSYEEAKLEWHSDQIRVAAINEIVLPFKPFDLHTTLTSLGYAVQMLYLIHCYSQFPGMENRFAILNESMPLLSYAASEIYMPVVKASEILFDSGSLAEENWAYAAMMKLIKIGLGLRTKLQNQEEQAH